MSSRTLGSVLVSTLVFSTLSSAAPCSELPVLFIVQDKSGSMNFAPDGSTASSSNPSKWSVAQSVVPSLATSFSNRFRFGVEMFPGATTTFNCTTGSVVSAVSYSPSDVAWAYSQAVAGGGTPTATSLSGAKTYLQGLGLTTPAYVLLITDGLPNCNLSLNPNSCTATTPGCANNSCGLGAKDCLDDTDTEAAAAALYAAGIPVFVVGFDSTLTLGNNKAVLDAIASAGGTGSAYVATNQTQLTSALNQIALNTATCCQDVCTAGTQLCTANGQQQTCALDPTIGCTTWTTQSCPNRSQCTGGVCQTCQDQCTLGAAQCNNGLAQQCVTAADGCTVWTTSQVCGYGELCSNGACSTCVGCNVGDSRCGANGLETCEWDLATGCTAWQPGSCNLGSTCQGGNCVACNTTCTAGTTRCNGMTVETCVADASGCTGWQPSQTCTNFCSGGACGSCGTSCNPGAVRCNGNGVETCAMDSNNCPVWNPSMNCGTGEFCSGGACSTCATSCNQGDKRCGANGAIETCQLDSSGVCTNWVTTGQCAQGQICSSGTCGQPCSDACQLGAAQCAANGIPQACQQGPAGCTVWIDQMACDQGTVCYQGSCDATCSNSEVDDCPAGYQCTGTTGGNVCLPAGDGGTVGSNDGGTHGADGGTHGADGGTGTGPDTNLNGSNQPDPHSGDSGPVKAMPGCGCNGGVGFGAPLIGLLALVLRRRRVSFER